MSTRISSDSEAFIHQSLKEGRYVSREALLDAAVRLLKDEEYRQKQSEEPATLSDEQWFHEFNAWVAGHDNIETIADDSRESIYADRGA